MIDVKIKLKESVYANSTDEIESVCCNWCRERLGPIQAMINQNRTWYYYNLSHLEDALMFRFRDEAIALEFALRFA